MLTYEQLDAVADSVNPALLAVTLVVPWAPGVRGKLRPIRWIVATALALGVVYSLRFIDEKLGLWPAWGLDYSTHSALAIALVTLWLFASKTWAALGFCIFTSYAILMVYQHYHTWADILTTALIVGPLAFVIGRIFLRPIRGLLR